MHFAKCFTPVVNAEGGLTVELYFGETPSEGPQGGATSLGANEAECLATIEGKEALAAELLPYLIIGKHIKANGGRINALLPAKINAAPEATIDLTGQSAAITL